MPVLDLSFASGESSLSVRRFAVREGISSLFDISIWARSTDPSIDLESLVGRPAGFRAVAGYAFALLGGARYWTGIVSYAAQVQPETSGLSTYYVRIVPALWLLTHRRGNRIFQHLTIPDIIDHLLGEWSLKPEWHIDRGDNSKYPKLEYKVQYGESDYVFLSRLLEEAGIAFTFPDDDKAGSKLVLGDRLHRAPQRATPPLPWVDNPNQSAEMEFVTRIRLGLEVRPGAHTIRDYDFRNPALGISGEAPKSPAPEDKYEQVHYRPGAFLVETGKSGDTPVADDRGLARYEQKFGKAMAERALLGERAGREGIAFETNTIDLWPGMVFAVDGHPHTALDPSRRLLVTDFAIEGATDEEWSMSGHAVFTEAPYRPPLVTKKPEIQGLQNAVVVGQRGHEISTDEFGRVRVQFAWDREGSADDGSSCWVRVSQGWGGTGYGMMFLPRIGQEVLVSFLNGDPDQPLIVGRLFNTTNPVPYKLPDDKTISTWKSDTSPNTGTNGFNEIKFEDKKANELFYVQAEKNLRKLVKHDETITVLHDRDKHIGVNETDTTGVNRTEITGVNRTELTGANRVIFIGGNEGKLVKGDEIERTEPDRLRRVGKNVDIVVKRKKRERIEVDTHQHVKGSRKEQIEGNQSLTIYENQYEKVIGSHALETGKDLHLVAGETMVGEGAHDVTLKGPGGFIRIDASGVTIKGMLVKINAGGAPGSGMGAHPEEPAEAIEAEPAHPEPISTEVTIDHRAPKPRAVLPDQKQRAEPSKSEHKLAAATDQCELKTFELVCSHDDKRTWPIKLPAAKGAKKPFDVLEVIAGDKGHGDKIKVTIAMANPRCATHKDALVITSSGARTVKTEETSSYEVFYTGIVVERDFFALFWPWNKAPIDYRFNAMACAGPAGSAIVRAYPRLEASASIKFSLDTANRVEAKIIKAQRAGKVEKRGRPADTDWAFEIKGEIKYGEHRVELGVKLEDKVRQWAAMNRLIKRAIDKFTEVFYEFTGVVLTPQFPAVALTYEGKFKEIDKSYKVGAEWSVVLKLDPLIGLTAKIEILDIFITALENTQFAILARGLRKVREFAKKHDQTFEIYLSFIGLIAGEVGAKKNADQPKGGAWGEVKGELKVEFGAKAAFGSKGWIGFEFGAEAKAHTGLAAKLTLDNNATGVFLKGKLVLVACKFQYAAWASGKFLWEIKESYDGEYTFWDDSDLLQSGDHYVLKNG